MSDTLFRISFEELCESEGIESQLVVQVVEYGIVTPVEASFNDEDPSQWLFDTKVIPWIQKAMRLHHDLEIDWVAVAMVIELLQQNEALQSQNEAYQKQLERFVKGGLP